MLEDLLAQRWSLGCLEDQQAPALDAAKFYTLPIVGPVIHSRYCSLQVSDSRIPMATSDGFLAVITHFGI